MVHDTFDLGQVEVVQGPILRERPGGTAGYIDLETKVPENRAFEDATVSHGFSARGSRPTDRATLDVNEPLDRTAGDAFRLNLMDQEDGVPGRELAETNRWGVAPSLALGLGGSTQVFFTYEHLYEHNLPDYGIPSAAVPGFVPPATPAAPSLFAPGVNPGNFYGFANFDKERVTSDTSTVRAEHAFASGLRLTDQVRYDANRRFAEVTSPTGNATTPFGLASLSHAIIDTKNRILSEQLNISDEVLQTGPVEHHLSSGLELSRENADNPAWSAVAAGKASPAFLASIYDPIDFPASLPNYAPHPTGSATDTRIDTGALYGFDTLKLGRFWEAVGGLRLEHYEVDELSVVAASPAIPAQAATPGSASAPGTAATAAVAAVPASAAELVAARTVESYKAGLTFKPAKEGSLYLSYNTSVRPPGTSSSTNALSTTASSADNPLLDPEKAINYEAGAKWEFFRDRLLATLAFFRSVNTHVPAADPVTGLVDQTSDQTVEGAELSLSGKLTEAWLISAGFAEMRPKVSGEISANAQGLTLPLLPRQSGSLWTTYELPCGLTAGAGAQYMGETERLQATQSPTATTFANGVPAYWLFNAMLSYAVDRHLTLRLNAANLADKQYVASLNNNGFRLNLGAPRSFLLTAELKF